MRTTKNTTSGIEVRVDPLGLDRLHWLKAFFQARGEKPSNSVIVRRALALYVEHIDKAMKNDQQTSIEVTKLKAHSYGDHSPWLNHPPFDGTPFGVMLRNRRKKHMDADFKRVFGFAPPGAEDAHE